MRASHLVAFLLSVFCLSSAFGGENNPNVITGYSDGFYLRTDDNRFKLKFGSRVQFGYSNAWLSGAKNFGKFEATMAKFFFGGNAFSQSFQYFVQASAANNLRTLLPTGATSATSGRFLLDDYFVRAYIAGLYLKLGKFKTPFGREWLVFDGDSQFVDRTAATQAFTFGRELGATLGYETKKLSIESGIFNNGSNQRLGVGYDPAGASASTPTSPLGSTTRGHGLSFMARLVASPYGPADKSEGDVENSEGSRLDIGAGFVYDHGRDADFNWDRTLDDNNVNVVAFGGDVTWKRQGKAFHGEFFYRKVNGKLTANTKGIGFYAQPSIFVIPKKLELAGRFGWVDPNRDVARDSVLEAAGATNFYISGDHRYKVLLQYTWRRNEQPAAKASNNHFMDLMFQFSV